MTFALKVSRFASSEYARLYTEIDTEQATVYKHTPIEIKKK